MIDIATVDFTVDAPPLGQQRLTDRANQLFDSWDSHLTSSLPLSDYYLRFELAEGSLKGKGKVAVVAGALYAGIAGFGSFMSGVHEIANISRSAGDYLLREADVQLVHDRRHPVRGRKSAAQLAQLEGLFVRVRRGELSPHEATVLADDIFADEGQLPRGFRDALHAAIEDIPRRAKQLDLELGYPEVAAGEAGVGEPMPKRDRRVPPIPPIPPPARFRVEVWRQSKKDPRHIHVEPL